MLARLFAVLLVTLGAVSCGPTYSNGDGISCENISRSICERTIAPAIRSSLKADRVRYELAGMRFVPFGCENWATIKPKADANLPELHVIYDACKHRAWINHFAAV